MRKIPIYGSMTRPGSPDEGAREMSRRRIAWNKGPIVIRTFTEEFTTICPKTGQPDFGSVEIRYSPDKWYLESKTLKFYFWSMRNFGGHCETLADKILADIVEAADPLRASVVVNQRIRGGVRISATKRYRRGARA